MRRRSALMAATFALLLLADGASAHDRSRSSSRWRVDGSAVTASFTVDTVEATRLGAIGVLGPGGLAAYLGSTLSPTSGGSPCAAVRPLASVPSPPGTLRLDGAFTCGDGELGIRMDAWFDVVPSHVHIAIVEGPAPRELVFTSSVRHHALGTVASREDRIAWVRLGVGHILGGPDHVAFLLGLLLLADGARSVLWLASGFTVGHSLTLSLAALSVVKLERGGVEAFIGLTIALVAIESIVGGTPWRWGAAVSLGALALALVLVPGTGLTPTTLVGCAILSVCYLGVGRQPDDARRLRPLVTLLFGLVHGFGFAGALADAGLQTRTAVGALLGFNVGVELGQLMAVAPVLALGGLGVRLAPAWRGACASGLCALGLFWFVTRALAA